MKKVVLSVGLISLFAVQAHAQVVFLDTFSADAQVLGATSLTNWSINSGANVDVIGTGFFDLYPGNNNYIDLNGTNATAATTLTTRNTISLAGGSRYGFSFDLGKNQSASQTLRIRVTDGVTTFVDQTISDSLSYPAFVNQGFQFNTSSSSAVNIIFDQSGPSNAGYVIDNVRLSVIPEPTTLALVGSMGLPLLMLARRRRNAS